MARFQIDGLETDYATFKVMVRWKNQEKITDVKLVTVVAMNAGEAWDVAQKHFESNKQNYDVLVVDVTFIAPLLPTETPKP